MLVREIIETYLEIKERCGGNQIVAAILTLALEISIKED